MNTKICLLLLGSSRYRLMYDASNRVCHSVGAVDWTHCRRTHYQIVDGKLCAPRDALEALAYF